MWKGSSEEGNKGEKIRDKEVMSMASPFYKVKCKDCNNLQIIFSKASTPVRCHICGTLLAEPTGGKAKIRAEIVEELRHD